jgi:hypothetical protein
VAEAATRPAPPAEPATETAEARGDGRLRRAWARVGPRGETPSRPGLWPAAGIVRLGLILILAFGLLRGGLWATTTPSYWGPDEDYHFMYVESLAHEHRLISPDRPLYTHEYSIVTDATQFNAYGSGGRTDFHGDPKAVLHRLSHLPPSARTPNVVGRGVGVVHPPLYHAVGALADLATDGKSGPTRMFWVRMVSALFGVLAIYGAWLLAAQVFRRRWPPLVVAFLVATQPMLGYLSGLVNHDIAVTAFYTLSLAMICFLLRTPAAPRQGLWLGLAISLALLVKATALVLVPIAALALVFQALAYDRRWRAALHSAALAAGAIVVLAGWWYVHSRLSYGTFVGAAATGNTGGAPAPVAKGQSLGTYLEWTREWTGDIYKTFWFHFINFEAPRGKWWYFAPAAVMVVGALGLLGLTLERWRTLLSPRWPQLRQALILALGAIALYAAFLRVDLDHRAKGAGFFVNGGRYILPAYPAIACLIVLGLLWLVRERARLLTFAALCAGSGWFVWRIYDDHFVRRYFDADGVSFWEQLRRISFDRPEFITRTTLAIALAAAALTLAGALVAIVLAVRREPEPEAEPAAAT